MSFKTWATKKKAFIFDKYFDSFPDKTGEPPPLLVLTGQRQLVFNTLILGYNDQNSLDEELSRHEHSHQSIVYPID